MTKLNQLKTKDDFARLLGFKNARYINYLLYNVTIDNLYKPPIIIPKKNGGERVIHAPKKELKFLQKKLSNVLCECYIERIESKSMDRKFKTPVLSHAF